MAQLRADRRSAALRTVAAGLILAVSSADAIAQQTFPATPAPYVDTIPAPLDVPYLGAIRLHVDATDTARALYRIVEDMPVSPGPQTLFYPAWQPGGHSIQNTAKDIAGLRITANGAPVEWRRDPVNVYAFHIVVPKGATSIHLTFVYLSPAVRSQGMIQSFPGVSWIEWFRMLVYPAGTYTRRIPVAAEVLLPKGYQLSSALEPASRDGDLVRFDTTDIDTLFDSPALAGAYLHREQLTPRVELDLVSGKDGFPIDPRLLAALRNLPIEARALFGVEHYGRYKFLAADNDDLGPVVEHHASSELRYAGDHFARMFAPADADMFPHEYAHSWNGKFMRPDDLWTPNYQVPMRGTGLWVYEGLTELWGIVLAARSGLMSKQAALDEIATIAAREQYQPGRDWKSVLDTTIDSAHALRRPLIWTSYQRQEDFYFEGVLIWLEVDAILRRESGNRRSLDDFAKAFFGGRDGDASEHSYSREDVVRVLQSIAPFDWRGFFHARVDETGPVPMGGIEGGGYHLVFDDAPNSFGGSWGTKPSDLSYSLGFAVASDGSVGEVIWDSPAFAAGMRPGSRIAAVNGQPFTSGALDRAVAAARSTGAVTLDLQVFGRPQSLVVHWSGGPRYPHLIRNGQSDAGLDLILKPTRDALR